MNTHANVFYPLYSSEHVAHVAHNISKALAKKGHLHILLLCGVDLLGIGGVIVRYRELSKALGKMGHHIFLIGPVYKSCRSPNLGDNVYVYPINMSFINNLKVRDKSGILWKALWILLFDVKCLVAVSRIFHSNRIDVCISSMPHLLPYLISKFFQLFWIFDTRAVSELENVGTIPGFFIPAIVAIERFLDKRADKLLVVSDCMKKTIVKLRGINPRRIVVSEDGADMNRFNPLIPKGACSQYRVSESSPVVLYVGSLYMAKGIDRVIRAMPYILKKYPDAKLVIVGGGSYSLDASSELRALVRSMNLDKNVVFTGIVPNVADYIADSNVCVCPSSLYFSPIKVYEYLACAKPVIVDKNVDIANLLLANNAGAVADTTNPLEFASVIIRLLEDKDFSQKISINGYKLVTNNFTWDIIAKKLVRLIESELMNKNATKPKGI
jgi:glycosyltransferase involved in cell wall biosynthesis